MDDPTSERTKHHHQQQQQQQQQQQHHQQQTTSFNSVKEAEANALRDHDIGREVVKPDDSEELIPSQYINIQRVPDVVNSKNFLSNTNLLTGNELLVDINGDIISSSSISLERYIPHQYEDDLLHDELTEDDKRLAAALVAVQLVNQQKQQSGTHILPMLATTSLPVASRLVNINEQISVMPSLTTIPNKQPVPGEQVIVSNGVANTDKNATGILHNYVQTEENALPPLPPLKRVLSRNRYMRTNFNNINQAEEDHQAHLISLGIHTEQEEIEISTEEIEIGTNEVIKTELSDFIIEEDTNLKTEACEGSEQLSEEEQESDGGLHDSDYENNGDKAKNKLPHKKRIPRKLKHPQKNAQNRGVNGEDQQVQLVKINTYKCSKCPEFFNSASAYAAHKAIHAVKRSAGGNQSSSSSFSCELCFKNFTNQWKFFEHLKSHYEPIELDPSSSKNAASIVGSKSNVAINDISKKDTKTNGVKPKTIQGGVVSQSQSTKLNSTKPKTTQVVAQPPAPQAAQTKWSSTTQTQDPNTQIGSSILYQQLTQGQTDQILFECEPCKRVFRRQQTYETHLSVAHPKQDEIEEFSEPEDMMEGIKVEVHSDDEKETPAAEKDKTIQKQWYREEDLHAAEAVLEEMEARTKTVYFDSHTCEMCNEAYSSKAELNQHISTQHAELMTAITKTVRRQPYGTAKKGNLHCKQCGRYFHHRNTLVYHLKSHLGERPHQCEVCGKGFFATSALKVHMRQHSGVKPFKCEFCGRNFRQWGDLKYHCISIHSDQKNFQCEYCGKDFARKYSLTVHSRIHTGERNYKCEFCSKSFRASSYLQNHRRIHTGEKPHPCEVCGKPFRVRSDMKRHMITHSKEPYSSFMMKVKREPDTPSSNSEDAKLIVQVDEQIPEMSKVEELEVSTVESILPDETVAASNRMQEELSVTYTERDPLESVARETNTLYVWPVYTT